jgi:hypothetical protein
MFPIDLPGVNPATLNGMLLYYRLMTKWSGLRDSTELSRLGLSHTSGVAVCVASAAAIGPTTGSPSNLV